MEGHARAHQPDAAAKVVVIARHPRHLVRRLADRVAAAVALACAAPILAAAAVLVRLVSPGPVLYRARRVGEGGRPFTMYKLRTMHWAESNGGPPITAPDDPRVFPAGAWLRRAKIDELPQLINVLLGDMAIVGPRPEDPAIVRRHYTFLHYETLRVPPGLTSPGSLYQCTHGDALLRGAEPVRAYIEQLFPLKLAIDLVYVRRASWWYDLAVVARTIGVLAAVLLGRKRFADPPELAEARRLTAEPVMPRPHRAGRRVVAVFVALLILAACRPDEPTEPPGSIGPPGPVAQLVGAGDIASCAYDRDAETAALLDTVPGVVFTTGDNAYPNGTPDEYVDCYGPTWGRHRARTRPSPGNHEYYTAGAAGYFGYFGAAAGPAGRGYYSYDLGPWHIISLNSSVDIDAGSAQMAWLRGDLAAHRQQCTLAYWHHPRFSSGSTHGSHTALQPVWDALFDAGVEVVITGHEHNYERFAPQTPAGTRDTVNGIRQFVVGTGGTSTSGFVTPLPNSEVRQSGTPGVLALTLQPNGYTWRFIAVPGATFTDAGSGTCHDAPASPPAGTRPAPE